MLRWEWACAATSSLPWIANSAGSLQLYMCSVQINIKYSIFPAFGHRQIPWIKGKDTQKLDLDTIRLVHVAVCPVDCMTPLILVGMHSYTAHVGIASVAPKAAPATNCL